MRHPDLSPATNAVTEPSSTRPSTFTGRSAQGVSEWAYRECLARRLRKRGLAVLQRVKCAACFGGERLEHGFAPDLLVQDAVIVELKVVEALHPAHFAQLRTYLGMTGKEVDSS